MATLIRKCLGGAGAPKAWKRELDVLGEGSWIKGGVQSDLVNPDLGGFLRVLRFPPPEN